MKHEHRLGWHESFLPLGPALREPVITISHGDMDAQAFEAGNFDIQGQAVAPPPAAPVHPSGVAPFKVGDRVRTCTGVTGVIDSASLRYPGAWYVRHDNGSDDELYEANELTLLPAPREQVAEPVVRQPAFKVGDRVRLLRAEHSQPRELIGTEATIDEWDAPFFRAMGFWWNTSEIELVAV